MKPCLFTLVLGALVQAQVTLNVPSPATPTIQSAITAAASGDVVEVAPGVYNETIGFTGTDITVRSVAGPAQTTIDAGGVGTAVTIRLGEGPATVLEGFTITNGDGFVGFSPQAGGMLIFGSSPTIRNCIVTSNVGRLGGAGGIHVRSGIPTIEDCVVSNNIGGDMPLGKNDGRGGAGGIAIDVFANIAGPAIRRCVVSGNQGGAAGGFFLVPGLGGAGGIGGIDFLQNDPFILLENVLVTGNTGGPAQPNGGTPPQGGAGGVQLIGLRLLAMHCTITGNMGGSAPITGAGGLSLGGVTPGTSLLANSIVWDDQDGAGSRSEIQDVPGNLIAYRCIVEGGFPPGIGILDADPMFVDTMNDDYTLAAASPAIDAGACVGVPVPTTDVAGEARVRGITPDLGAHESAGRLVNLLLIGTCEDFVLETLAGGGGGGDPTQQSKQATAGDALSLGYGSPSGTFVGVPVFSLIEAYQPAFPPDGVPGLPELDLGANVILLETFNLPAAGSAAAGVVPFGLAGFTLRFQGLAVSAAAENGLYAVTHAHDLEIH